MQTTIEPLSRAQTALSTDLARPHPARKKPASYWASVALRHGLFGVFREYLGQ